MGRIERLTGGLTVFAQSEFRLICISDVQACSITSWRLESKL
jgi:hypothetical protein